MIHPVIFQPREWPTVRRLRRRMTRPGRRLATGDDRLSPGVTDGRREDLAAACRAALEALGHGADVRAAERALLEVMRLDVVVTTRTNNSPATCDAPNCAGHRTRA